jgi:hypothetical protein
MSEWATNRQRLLIAIGVSLVVALGVIILVPILYQTPSCSDGKQNQDEDGIDCGGSCAYLCKDTARPLSTQFVQGIVQNGRADAIAYIDNRNADAALEDAKYTVELYDETRTLIGSKQGTIDVPPSSTVPIFVSGIAESASEIAQAFITFDDNLEWFRSSEKPSAPTISDTRISSEGTPRIVATIGNPTPRAMTNVRLVITVFGASGNAIAASQTVVASIAPQGTAEAVFTWNEAFIEAATRVDVLPVLGVTAP